jgi:prolipoprotein diacylglyceryl transferase
VTRLVAVGFVADIPSPGSNSLSIGPVDLNAYGLMIALGVIAGVWLLGRRLEERSLAKREVASQISLWAVLAGVVGARLYHVVTDWHRFEDNLGDIPKVWQGGLGIPGGLIAGIPVGMWMAKRHGLSAAEAATCAAPAIPLAQAIGRWGNWFNQELYGRPTDLPWALEIDADHLPNGGGYDVGTTFHPTFLYESLWNFGLCGVLLWVDRKWSIARGGLLAVYIMGYGVGRLWVEGIRIDPADEIGGLRFNQWMAIAAIIGGGAYLVWVARSGGIARRRDAARELPDDNATKSA